MFALARSEGGRPTVPAVHARAELAGQEGPERGVAAARAVLTKFRDGGC